MFVIHCGSYILYERYGDAYIIYIYIYKLHYFYGWMWAQGPIWWALGCPPLYQYGPGVGKSIFPYVRWPLYKGSTLVTYSQESVCIDCKNNEFVHISMSIGISALDTQFGIQYSHLRWDLLYTKSIYFGHTCTCKVNWGNYNNCPFGHIHCYSIICKHPTWASN